MTCSALVSVEVAPVLSACAGLAACGCACLHGVLGVDGFRMSPSCLGNSGVLSDPDISTSVPWAVDLLVWESEVLGLGEGALMNSSVGVGLGSLGGSISAAERRGGSSVGAVASLSSSGVGICPADDSEWLVSAAGEGGLLSSWLMVAWV